MRIETNPAPAEDCSAEWIESRLQSALSACAEKIVRIRVTTGDITTAKGGCDKTCRVTAHLRDGSVLTISERRSDLPAAVTWAAGKIAEAIRRRLERRVGRRRSRPDFGSPPPATAERENLDDSGESAGAAGPLA